MADCRPTTKRKTRRKTAPAKPEDSAVAKKPAYLRRKMAVSQPQDPEEQEADKVAKEVARSAPSETPKEGEGPTESREMIASKPVSSARRLLRRVNRAAAAASEPPPEEVSRAKTARSVETEDQEPKGPVQKLRRKEGKEDPDITRIRRKSAPEEQDEGAVSTAKRKKSMSDDEAATEAMTVRRERGGTDAAEQTEKDGEPDAGIEKRIEQARGRGAPLPETVLQDMQAQLGQDLSQVRIHTDDEASALCKELSARAFTVGNDIFFDAGEYAPESDAGRELLAHELTHVVQQDGGQTRRKIARQVSSEAVTNFDVTEPLEIPPIKARHGGRYQAMAAARRLVRQRGRPSENRHTAQIREWKANVQPDLSRIPAEQRPTESTGFRLILNTGGGERTVGANSRREFQELISIPTWNSTGASVSYQVDHIVEFQLGGTDTIDNMELLDASHNGSVGSSFRYEIVDAVRRTIEKLQPADPKLTGLSNSPSSRPTPTEVLDKCTTVFANVASTGGHERRRSEGTSTFWSRESITALEHVLPVLDASPTEKKGTAALLSLLSPTGGLSIAKLPHGETATGFPVMGSHKKALSGFEMDNVVLNAGYNSASNGNSVGNVFVKLDLGPTIRVVPDAGLFGIALIKDETEFAVRLSANALENLPPEVQLTGASPVTLSNYQLGRGLSASAILRPTHPLLVGLELPGRVENGRLGLYYTMDATALAQKLPIPGVQITDAAITLGFDGENLSASGGAEFTVRNFGNGRLQAAIDSSGTFAIEGTFEADSKLFDENQLALWFRSDTGFGGRGRLAITDPKKIKGIRSASITAEYNDGSFSANGDVQPDIPGVQRAALTAAYNQETGLTIGGELQLAPNKAIRSGSVQVTLNKQGEDWKVSATGTAQPNIPGIDSQLTATYDDGAFTVGFSGAYRKGKLAGTVTVGATNRAIGADGTPSGDPTEGRALTVYGSGSATLQIAPWLQGTAGLKLDANGEITISGEIGLPNSVEIFPRKEIEKRLLNVAVQIPIIPGIVAEIGGGLSAKAGVGPGLLEQLKIGVTYNPSREDQTRVTGDAHLRVPADAGLTLGVRAGIGLGITGASATGGLEVTGTLGLQGAAEATVHVEWTPQQGLNLEARLAVSAQPVFTFGVGGYVSVRVLGFSVYDQTWSLASFSFGSDYRFGVALPVRYQEGQPFDISTDDIEFTVPDISPREILSGLIDRIK